MLALSLCSPALKGAQGHERERSPVLRCSAIAIDALLLIGSLVAAGVLVSYLGYGALAIGGVGLLVVCTDGVGICFTWRRHKARSSLPPPLPSILPSISLLPAASVADSIGYPSRPPPETGSASQPEGKSSGSESQMASFAITSQMIAEYAAAYELQPFQPEDENRNRVIATENLGICQSASYEYGETRVVLRSSSDPKPVSCVCEYAPPSEAPASGPGPHKTHFLCVPYGYNIVARALHHHLRSAIGILNLGNNNTPGGGYRGGAKSQEEALCRDVPELYPELDSLEKNGAYAINSLDRPARALYTKHLRMIRGGSYTGYSLLPQPIPVSVISSAAFNCIPKSWTSAPIVWPKNMDAKDRWRIWNQRALVEKTTGRSDLETTLRNNTVYMQKTKARIFALLTVAKQYGERNLVLGAWGCGSFGNPPAIIADFFEEAFRDPEFQGCFDHVVFAIPPTTRTDRPRSDTVFKEMCQRLD